jgi:hypothetical protein
METIDASLQIQQQLVDKTLVKFENMLNTKLESEQIKFNKLEEKMKLIQFGMNAQSRISIAKEIHQKNNIHSILKRKDSSSSRSYSSKKKLRR